MLDQAAISSEDSALNHPLDGPASPATRRWRKRSRACTCTTANRSGALAAAACAMRVRELGARWRRRGLRSRSAAHRSRCRGPAAPTPAGLAPGGLGEVS